MKLIIDIPDHLYTVIKNKECTHRNVLTEAVYDGIPLEEPKTGHWIERRSRATGRIESVCSQCGAEEGYPYNDYCGNCGARMIEPQVENEG